VLYFPIEVTRTMVAFQRRHKILGNLSNTMMLIILVFGVLSVVFANTLFQVKLGHNDHAQIGSRRIAQATANVAVARLLADPDLQGESLPSLEMDLGSYPDSQGVVAFDEALAEELGVPVSINNLSSNASVPGPGDTLVLPETAVVYSLGRWQGRERLLEVVLHVPKFPYALASNSPIKAGDGVKVFGVRDPATLDLGYSSVPPEERDDGHVATNASDGERPSLLLSGGDTLVEGDAQSVGSVEMSDGAMVDGELRPQAADVPLPEIDLNQFDPTGKPGLTVLETASLGSGALSGFNRRSGDLSVSGGLSLDNAVLFVDGDLNVRGGVRGKGAMVVKGEVNISGGGALAGSSQLALLAEDQISIEGSSLKRAEFRGLIYSEGGLVSRHANVAGAVAINSNTEDPPVVLENVNLVESEELSALSIEVVTEVAPTGEERGFQAVSSASLPEPVDWGIAPRMQQLEGTNRTLPVNFLPAVGEFKHNNYESPPSGYPVTHQPTAEEPWYEIGIPDPMPSDPFRVAKSFIINSSANGPCHEERDGFGFQDLGRTGQLYVNREDMRRGILGKARQWGITDPEPKAEEFLNKAEAWIVSEIPTWVDNWNHNARLRAQSGGQSSLSGSAGISTEMVVVDFSEFLSLSDRIRVLSWRER
jgi:hypothetical protein